MATKKLRLGRAGQHGLDALLEFREDGVRGAMSVNDREAVKGLQSLELLLDLRLVFQKGIEHVAREAHVHAALPIVEREVLLESALDKFFRRDIEIEHRVRYK